MPTLLHISDLHRTSKPRLDNDMLLAAIVSDATRWDSEGLPKPDLVVVSGDLIQGSDLLDAAASDSEIKCQYAEASDFLQKLATEFVNSDRSRIIIVPGNHDVHWHRARKAMKPLTDCPAGIKRENLRVESKVRWSWDEQKAYKIADEDKYESRLRHFREFRADFYAGLDPDPLRYSEDLVMFEYPALGIVIVGFASWHGNDHFCDVGEIAPSALASSRKILAQSQAPIAIAVWHHSVVGNPRTSSYMDQRVVHTLIDFGFNVGLHGHQHYSGAAPSSLNLPNLTSMAVIGAGSLAVGNEELPMGERRQFNIVDIDPRDKKITVHVRAMSTGGIFTGSHRDDFGGETFIELELSPSRLKPTTCIQHLDEAMTAIAAKEYEKALSLLAKIGPSYAHRKRKVKIMALEGMGLKEELIQLLDPPEDPDEVVKVVSALCDIGRYDEAEECLNAASELIELSLRRDLSQTISARMNMS